MNENTNGLLEFSGHIPPMLCPNPFRSEIRFAGTELSPVTRYLFQNLAKYFLPDAITGRNKPATKA
jgi:hypothetical protein